MEKSSSFDTWVVEREPSLRITVLDKQGSFTMKMESMEDEKKIESSNRNQSETPIETVLDIETSSSIESNWKGNNGGKTALYIAAENGNLDIVREISKSAINQSVALNVDSCFDSFHIAAKLGHADVMKELLHSFPTLITTTDLWNTTALYTAASRGHLNAVNLLIEADASIARIARSDGKTALHIAAKMGHLEVLKSLHLKDPSLWLVTDRKGQTALHIAEKYFNEEIAALLREAGGSLILRKEEAKETGEIQIEKDPLHQVNLIKQEVKFQLRKSCRTQMSVYELKKKVEKMTKSGLSKANNSNIVVATLIFSSAFAAIFQIPGQSTSSAGDGYSLGQAYIAYNPVFGIFLLSNTFALFVSLAVVVAQTTLIVVDPKAMKWMVFVINKLMWVCCISISVSFVSLAYVVVRRDDWWLAWSTLVIAIVILISTLGIMCYLVITHRMQQKKLKRNMKKVVPGIKVSYLRGSTLVSNVLLKAQCHKKMYAI